MVYNGSAIFFVTRVVAMTAATSDSLQSSVVSLDIFIVAFSYTYPSKITM